MATQSLIWTALPNGYADPDKISLRISVLLSPRLDSGTEPPVLGTFSDFRDWPTTLSNSTFKIICPPASVTIPGNQTKGPNRVDTSLAKMPSDTATWLALFPPSTYVKSFGFEKDLTNRKILSYDTRHIASLVSNLYGKLAQNADGNMPQVSQIVDNPGWISLYKAVSNIDKTFSTEDGLRDPEKQFKSFRRERGWEELSKLSQNDPNAFMLAAMLAQFQLFHTPPAKAKPVTFTRTDDPRISATWTQYERAKIPDKYDLAKTIDFHQIVAAMNQYPVLLRRLGLVIDFVVEAREFARFMPNSMLLVSVQLPRGSRNVTRKENVSLRTHVMLSDTKFQALSKPGLKSFENCVVDGLLDINERQFALMGVDVDGSGLKLMNFARSLARLSPKTERVDPVTKFEKELGTPSLRNGGLTLVQTNRSEMLQTKLTASLALNTATESVANGASTVAPELWAEDIVRGYRIDIWDSKTTLWRSLCQRESNYSVGNELQVHVDSEEGIVRLAATKAVDPSSNPEILYLHEALVTWTGWSLTAPVPGGAIKPDDSQDITKTQIDPEIPPGLNFSSKFTTLKNSLPRLRYGREYWIRARTVDLAGNSVPPRSNDFGPEQPASRAQPYLRYDPLVPPVIALAVPSDLKVVKPPEEGESMERIAIRSFNDNFSDRTPSKQTTERFAVPPRSSVREAEQHGMFDVSGKMDSSSYNLLAKQDNPLGPAPFKELSVPPFLEVDDGYAVFKENTDLPYLPDPMAKEVVVKIFNHPAINETELITIPLYTQAGETSHWPAARPFKIHAYEDQDSKKKPYYDETTHTLYVPLPKATCAKARLSMKLSKDDLKKMGVWHWLSPNDQLQNLALNGQHWMLTPYRDIEFVHGVQRPLIAPTFVQQILIGRSLGNTFALPVFQATCSIKSTDRIDLRAKWNEPNDDPTSKESEKVQTNHNRGDLAFSIKIADPKFYALVQNGYPQGGFAEHKILKNDVIGVNLSDASPTVTALRKIVPKVHEFHDTRYRRIVYWIEATTRFREYMPESKLLDPAKNEPTDENITVRGPEIVTWIPSSAPPPAPKILYVVPTFGWTRSKDITGTFRSWRRGGGLRVYLDRPWDVSGYGEMLGVVLLPVALTPFAGDPNDAPKEYPYAKYITQWGNDPIWLSPFVTGAGPRLTDFPLARTQPDPNGKWLPPGAPNSEKDQPPGQFKINDLPAPGLHDSNLLVDVAPHDVYYDEERRLWYCDIEINTGSSYYPFIRLALARYQPVSVDGAHLSNVTFADIMPLAADRWLNINQTADPLTRYVTVYGPSYSNTSGSEEAKGSTVHPSGKSIVEVWAEHLDPRLGIDFGWLRVPDAPVQIVLDKIIPAVIDKPRAQMLLQNRQFDTLTNEGLLGALLFQELWHGNVRLPAIPTPIDRYRIVIAEYEEYLVDGASPYSKIPDKKDRRLVFVEHIEIT